MSGPITCGYIIMHGVLMLSARALREAQAMKREYGQVLAQLGERELSLAQARAGQRTARLERIAAVRGEAARQSARLLRLRSLGQALEADAPHLAHAIPADLPAAPTGDDDAAWTDYLRRLETAVRELETLLADAGAAFGERLRAVLAATTAAPTIDDVLSAYVLQRQLKAGLDSVEAERFRQTAARVLARLELPAGAALPTELEALARAVVLAPTLERAEALATELRLAVQQQRDAHLAQSTEATEAKRAAGGAPGGRPGAAAACARARGRRCRAARRRLALRRAAGGRRMRLRTASRQEQDAAALVLQESLRDLGYEVEDIEATLFVDGGTVHFRRAGWDNYFVRLRLSPRERSVNFNVVRARRRRGNRGAKATRRARRGPLVRGISQADADAGRARAGARRHAATGCGRGAGAGGRRREPAADCRGRCDPASRRPARPRPAVTSHG